jgi:hypothetical protein
MPRCFVLTFPLLLIWAGIGICADTQAPPPAAEVARERAVTAESFVNERLAIWQKRLKLEDWHLVAKLVRSGELKPKTLGNIHWDTPTKIATIRVLALADYKLPYHDALRDMEFTVVHELVHLQLSSLPRSDASRGAEERAVNQLTEALLELAGRR